MISKVVFINLGKFKSSEYDSLFKDYVSRLTNYTKVEVKDIKIIKDEPHFLDKLTTKIKEISKDSKLVVLTERGQNLTSLEFSKKIERDSGVFSILVGTSWGIPEWAQDNAYLKISFGKLTMPHEAVRVLCAEQIYRAFTIIKGEGYHK